MVKLTPEQVLTMKDVSDDLEKVLAIEFPECEAFPFGSFVSGLGFNDCDLDIYVDLCQNAKDETFYVKAGMWGQGGQIQD